MISVHSIVGDEYKCYCPLHDDDNPSLHINLKKNAAFCFAGCYAGSAIGLIAIVENISPQLARRKLITNHIFQFERLSHGYFAGEYSSQEAENLEWESAEDCKYLLDRGFSPGVLKSWEIGYNKSIEHIKISIYQRYDRLQNYWSGKVTLGEDFVQLGTIYRTTGKLKPTYLYNRGLPKRLVLFGEDHFGTHDGVINIVEGSLDCIWMHQIGFTNTLAILGSYMSEQQRDFLLEMGGAFQLCFDNDEAGGNACARAMRLLGKNRCEVVTLPGNIKDVQELAPEKLIKVMSRR